MPTRLMLACYPPSGGRYVAHLDNDPSDPAYEARPLARTLLLPLTLTLTLPLPLTRWARWAYARATACSRAYST